ncbi:MAG: hypothetical protein IPM94_08170 [bacterium]|nr:hypothetical protein [bacterium]
MMNMEKRIVWQIPHSGDMGDRDEFGILNDAWGPGLASAQIYELHSGLGLDMIKFALRIVSDAVRRELNVAYFDVKFVLTDDLVQKYVWGDMLEAGWGLIEVFYPTTFDHLAYSLRETYTQGERYDLIIVDSFSDIRIKPRAVTLIEWMIYVIHKSWRIIRNNVFCTVKSGFRKPSNPCLY